ncbi:ImmA/IrrE family metallo-endopeptidase [Xanthomonas cissicola]|uniref:ImmA/IrrE family metallo-endopeptidase n=1 Tax=Xanthomonas cissicola TaxID=86186 RepID=UPI000997917E|nr:ImmA/IrrE family metallo-endopeptidase [Xanthomonas cissicola]KAB0537525.1 ImmA/IrrE family metallo-endopeptidase [Xanthomonas cissicola]
MDSYRRQQIEARAQDMLNDAGVLALPINPMEIAKHLDIQVHAKPANSSGASGWLVRQGNDFAIIYATHIENPGFQNFSVAHELGHYCLDGHPEHIFKQSGEHASRGGFGSSDPIEREADYFASCLMMPKSLCKSNINKSGDGMAAVLSLAATCNTSLTAAALRYAEIGHLPTGVLQCLDGKVEFCAIYPLQSHVGWARPLGRGTKVPLDSATRRLADDPDGVRRALEDSDSAEASDWFSGAKSGIYLIEEVIGLGSFGRTLTLLTLEENDEDEDD